MLLVVLVLLSGSPGEHLAHANALMEALEYDQAADELIEVVSDPTASADERLQANVLAGVANRIRGHEAEARLNFRYVLLEKPDFTLPPTTSPKVSGFLELVRQELRAEQAAAAPAAPPPAPVPAPAPPPPAPSGIDASVVLMGVGAAAAVGSAGVAAWAELALDTPQPIAQREPLLTAGRAGLVGAGVGVAVAAAGGLLWALAGD